MLYEYYKFNIGDTVYDKNNVAYVVQSVQVTSSNENLYFLYASNKVISLYESQLSAKIYLEDPNETQQRIDFISESPLDNFPVFTGDN